MIEANQNRARRPWGVSLGLVLATLAAFLIPAGGPALQLDRGSLAAGEWWVLFTGHFTHWNLDHLTWDLLAFAVLGVFCESHGRSRFLFCLAPSALAISVGFVLFETSLISYRGLSGLDSALFGLAMVTLFRVRGTGRWLAIVGIVGFLGKSLVEMAGGGTVFVEAAGFVPVPSAHLIGFGCGLLSGFRPKPGTSPPRAHPAPAPRPSRYRR